MDVRYRFPSSCTQAELVPHDPRDALLLQAAAARELGSSLVAGVLSASYLLLDHAPKLRNIIASWPHDPRASAMALRLNAGIHALARQGTIPSLSALFAQEHDDFLVAIADVFQQGEDTLIEWMRHPTQTNEVARSGAFMAALMKLARHYRMPFELLEIGASAGLNLGLDRYSHQLGRARAGNAQSPVRIAPEWRGKSPAPASVRIRRTVGTDLRPLRVCSAASRELLHSYVWADDAERAERLVFALELARHRPPRVDRASAALWLERQLSRPQVKDTVRVVMHSMVHQYLPSGERARVHAAVGRAAARASRVRPLAVIGFEWNAARTQVRLEMSCWDGRVRQPRRQLLAVCHAYAAWIDWRA